MALIIKNLKKENLRDLKRSPFIREARIPAYFYYSPDLKDYIFVLSQLGGFVPGRRFDILEVEDSELDEKDRELQILRAENKALKERIVNSSKENLTLEDLKSLAESLGYYVAKRPVRKEASEHE